MKYLLIMIFLILLLLLFLHGCYTGVPDMGTIYSPHNPSPGIKKGEVIYYNATGGEEGVKTYFHGGEVTRCITTSSTVTCY